MTTNESREQMVGFAKLFAFAMRRGDRELNRRFGEKRGTCFPDLLCQGENGGRSLIQDSRRCTWKLPSGELKLRAVVGIFCLVLAELPSMNLSGLKGSVRIAAALSPRIGSAECLLDRNIVKLLLLRPSSSV